MKVCQACNARFESAEWRCPQCAFQPALIAGYVAHAPFLASDSASGFSVEEFGLLASLEERSFWFRGRNKLLISALRRYCGSARCMLEIGCGTGFVLRGVGAALPRLTLYGSEVALAGLAFAKARNPAATLFQMDATAIPYEEEFDVIGAFDVLEHIEDDARVVAEVFRALKPAGHAIISVPQHMFLWSDQDRRAQHFRRYAVDELQDRLEATGFRVELKSSFVTLLLPALYLSRRWAVRRDAEEATSDLRLPPVVNRVFEWTLDLERKLIDWGGRLPVGGSQLIVAEKPG